MRPKSFESGQQIAQKALDEAVRMVSNLSLRVEDRSPIIAAVVGAIIGVAIVEEGIAVQKELFDESAS